MADISDVEIAVAGVVQLALYPAGVSSGSAVSPIAGVVCDIRRGWPLPGMTDAAIAAGQVLVTVHADGAMSRRTSRYQPDWKQSTTVAATLTAVAAGTTVTFGGTGGLGQVAGVAYGLGAQPAAYSYRLIGGDTPSSIAASLAAAMSRVVLSPEGDAGPPAPHEAGFRCPSLREHGRFAAAFRTP